MRAHLIQFCIEIFHIFAGCKNLDVINVAQYTYLVKGDDGVAIFSHSPHITRTKM